VLSQFNFKQSTKQVKSPSQSSIGGVSGGRSTSSLSGLDDRYDTTDGGKDGVFSPMQLKYMDKTKELLKTLNKKTLKLLLGKLNGTS
jgi:hypothetical protein